MSPVKERARNRYNDEVFGPSGKTRFAVLIAGVLTAILPLLAQAASLRIRVTDPTGARVWTSSASLLGPDDKPKLTARANSVGEIIVTDLPPGEHRFVVSAPGFKKRLLTLTLSSNKKAMIETALEVCGGILETC